MHEVGIVRHDDYIDHLSVHPEEFDALFNTILINVTSFFRDPDLWEELRTSVVPELVTRDQTRVWSAGTASGQEAYSVVMLLAEAMGKDAVVERVKVYATDVDSVALEQARLAVYRERDLEGLPEGCRETYFEETSRGWVFDRDLRRVVIFGRHDLLVDAPISRVDLLLCRNTLMYFNAEVQQHLVNRLHFALTDGGVLVLGKVEMLLGQADLFQPLVATQRIFRKVPRTTLRGRLLAMAGGAPPTYAGSPEEQLLERAFEERVNADVLLDASGDLVVANARARALFTIPADAFGRPFQDLDLSYRPVELRSWIDRAREVHRAVQLQAIECRTSTGDRMFLDVDIVPLGREDGPSDGVLVSFSDMTPHRQVAEELEQAQRELEAAYESLQSSNEELETTNEELQSTIEELETTNEELQSTNDELETMNEELTSTNEELRSINEELRDRTSELNQVTRYMDSILSSLHVAIVVVDRDLRVRVWNGRSYELWGLRADEVEGRDLLSIDVGFPVEALAGPLRDCLAGRDTDVPPMRGVTRRGAAVVLDVWLSPLRGAYGEIEGAIVLIGERGPPTADRPGG